MIWEVFDFEPEQGPPKPLACAAGWQSHVWRLSIEAAQLCVSCDCNLCHDGMQEAWEDFTDAVEMDGIPVTVSVEIAGTPPDGEFPILRLTPHPERAQ